MAYTPLKVHIPTPCHEDWNGMQPVPESTARHCSSCVKNVVDFTGFTDAQMHAYLRDNPGKMCGRFRPDQINRPIRAAGERRSHPLRAAAAAAGLLLASSGCTTENNSQDTLEASRSTPEEYTLVEPPRTGGIAVTELPEEEIIEIPVPGMVDRTLPLPPPPPLVGEAVLETAPHPEPKRIPEEEEIEWIVGDIEIMEPEIMEPSAPTCHLVPPPPPPPPPLIDTAQTGADLLGLVVIDYPQPTGMDLFLDTIKSILPPSPKPTTEQTKHLRSRPNGTPPYLENLTLFPNPFVELINVEIDVPEATRFTVRMIDNAGRQITSDRWNALPGYNTFILRPPQRRLKGGTYYVQITDDTGHSISRAVIRQ